MVEIRKSSAQPEKHQNDEEETTPRSLLKKNINVFLLFFLMIIILTGVAFVVFFQGTLKDITLNASEKTEGLTACTSTLEATKQNLINLYAQFNQSQKDVKTYDEIYERKESELEDARDELSDAQRRLVDTTTRLATTEKLYSDAKTNLAKAEKDLVDVKAVVADQKTKINHLEIKVQCLRETNDAAEDNC